MAELEKVLSENPNVDASEVAKAIRIIQERKASGRPRKGYDLARPFSVPNVRGKPLGRWRPN